MKLPTSQIPKTEQRLTLSANNISLIARAILIFLNYYEETHHFVMFWSKSKGHVCQKKTSL